MADRQRPLRPRGARRRGPAQAPRRHRLAGRAPAPRRAHPARAAPKPPRRAAGARPADRARHRQLGRDRQGPLRGARRPRPADHQVHDGRRRDGHDHPVALRRGDRADRRPSSSARSRSSTPTRRSSSPRSTRTSPRISSPARPSSRSWATSTTARRRSSTRSASRAVVETEAGGITQHIGAYQVDHDGRRVTFLDTPGHEAFTALRARGAKVTDIAVLVVAADDGVMPQTIESINHARAAEVPIVVAVNKIDRPEANPTRVRQELVAARAPAGGVGRDDAVRGRLREDRTRASTTSLEQILLVADAELELTANPKAEASGPIIESRLDVGRGPVATMLVARGTLRVGDAIVAGDAWGKVRALYDYRGERVKEAAPGTPVEILGFDKPPAAGEHGARRRERAPGAPPRGPARPARCAPSSSRGSRRRASRSTSSSRGSGGRRPGPQHHRQGRRPGLASRPSSASSRRSSTPRCAVNVIHTGIGGDHRERRHARVRLERDRRGLQRAPERRGARARRARGRRRPHLPRHLPAHRGHPAGARRHALARAGRGDARRGRGARALPRLAARRHRGLLRHERRHPAERADPRRPRRHRRLRDDDREPQALQGRRRARCRRASSAASCSRASTT